MSLDLSSSPPPCRDFYEPVIHMSRPSLPLKVFKPSRTFSSAERPAVQKELKRGRCDLGEKSRSPSFPYTLYWPTKQD